MASTDYHFSGASSTAHGGGMGNGAAKAQGRRRKIMIAAGIALLVILAAVGVGVGVTLSKKNNKDSESNNSSSVNNTGGDTGDDPSSGTDDTPVEGGGSTKSNTTTTVSDEKVFFGLAYTPHNALIELGCANTLESVIKDVELIAQYTTRIRLYGASCNQSAMVLEAIKQTGVDLKVYLGIYSMPEDDHKAYREQKDAIRLALETYGADNVVGITVGNEFMLNWVSPKNSTDPNDADAKIGAAILVQDILETRTMLEELGMTGQIEVGNSDAGSYFSTDVLSVVDYGLSNVHAWFAGTPASEAAAWVFEFFESQNVIPAAALPNKPRMYIAETGWPSNSKDAEHLKNGLLGEGSGTAELAGLQSFLDTFVCEANKKGVPYFFFEMFDEKWKDDKYGGVEGYWGLFNGDRTMKDVTMPVCTSNVARRTPPSRSHAPRRPATTSHGHHV